MRGRIRENSNLESVDEQFELSTDDLIIQCSILRRIVATSIVRERRPPVTRNPQRTGPQSLIAETQSPKR